MHAGSWCAHVEDQYLHKALFHWSESVENLSACSQYSSDSRNSLDLLISVTHCSQWTPWNYVFFKMRSWGFFLVFSLNRLPQPRQCFIKPWRNVIVNGCSWSLPFCRGVRGCKDNLLLTYCDAAPAGHTRKNPSGDEFHLVQLKWF